jgi:hypothetical protein
VLSLVPAGFAAYVRIFHPAHRSVGATLVPVRWSEIAASAGKQAHPGMQLVALTGSERFANAPLPGVYDDEPSQGSLPPELAEPLAATLTRHTATPERCWFAAWAGWGGLGATAMSAPTFEAPYREYHLLFGPVLAASETVEDPGYSQSPNLWWPDDRAWCVAAEIDLNTTYVGCGEACRDAILALDELEALPIDPATGISWRSDLVNPWPEE